MTLQEHQDHSSTRIVINGQEYDSLEDVPEQYRELLRDDDGDGVPDVLQGATSRRMQVARVVRDGKTTYTYNGQQFERIEALPDEARRFLERQTAPGAPELQATPAHPVQPAAQRPEPPGQQAPPMGGAGASRWWTLAAALAAAVLAVGLIGWLAGWF